MPPKTAAPFAVSTSGRDPFRGFLPEFVDWLERTGLSANQVAVAVGSSRHFLIWLHNDGAAIERVDDAVLSRFRHHDCRAARCTHSRNGHCQSNRRRSREYMSRVGCLVKFLEETGRMLHPGELGEGLRLAEEFLEWRKMQGYASSSLIYDHSACRHFLIWLHGSRIPMAKVDRIVLNRFIDHDCLCPGGFRSLVERADPRDRYVRPIEHFMAFLVARGRVPDTFTVPGNVPGEELDAFRGWLEHHRGTCKSTIERHVREVATLLPALGDDASRYDAALIRDVLLRRFAEISCAGAAKVTTSMRMYLRFLASSGKSSPALIGAVPAAVRWRLSSLPRYLPADDIESVIASCDVARPLGMRDRAILLLLARLALRAGDVADLRLGDIDWRRARLHVRGKSRRRVGLPLPQDAGDALLDYIERARPRVDEDKVFLRSLAPHRPFADSDAVGAVVARALKRAGVDGANGRGARVFRHSAATNLLRSGTSLELITALLRHRSPDTTAIYAKVDLPMLQEVAQAWMGDAR